MYSESHIEKFDAKRRDHKKQHLILRLRIKYLVALLIKEVTLKNCSLLQISESNAYCAI